MIMICRMLLEGVVKILTVRKFTNIPCLLERFGTTYVLSLRSFVNDVHGKNLPVRKVIQRNVSPFGTVKINCPYNVVINPTDPHSDNPNKIVLTLLGKESSQVNVELSNELEVQGTIQGMPQGKREFAFCTVDVPVKYDLKVVCTQNGSLSVSGMESDSIEASLENGNIHSSNLRCPSIQLACREGDICCQGVHLGKVNLHAEKGNISGNKFLGKDLHVFTGKGNVEIMAVYSDVSHFVARKGNISLKNLHGKSKVDIEEKGSLVVSGLDGTLQACVEEGNMKVQISRLQGHSHLETKLGNAEVSVPEDLKCKMDFQGVRVSLPKSIRHQGVFQTTTAGENYCYKGHEEMESCLRVLCYKGDLKVDLKDWLSTLNLGSLKDVSPN